MGLIEDLTVLLGTANDMIGDMSFDDLPWVPLDDEDFYLRLPVATSAIYFVRHRVRGVLYVGRASNIRGRWGPEGTFVGTTIAVTRRSTWAIAGSTGSRRRKRNSASWNSYSFFASSRRGMDRSTRSIETPTSRLLT